MDRHWILVAVLGAVACAQPTRPTAAPEKASPAPRPEKPTPGKYDVTPTPDPTSPSGFYIPVDLEDAFRELDKMLSQEFRDEFKSSSEQDLIRYHFGLGLWMRNNWGLWSESRLAQSLSASGLRHPDDMSGLIITAYWRRLNGKELGVEAEVQRNDAYWESAKEPEDKACPEDKSEMSVKMQLVEQSPDGQTTLRHVGQCEQGHLWIYSVGSGWERPSEEDLKRIGSTQAGTNQQLAP